MVHKDTLIQVYFKWVSSWFILDYQIGLPKVVMDVPFLSQFQIPRTLKRSSGAKKWHSSACAAATAGRVWSLPVVSWQLTVFLPFFTTFQQQLKIGCESDYSFVLFKFEARTLWQPSERFPSSFGLQTWGNCRAASKQRSTGAKEPTAFHFALCYVKPYLGKMSQICTAMEQISKAAKQSLGSKCMFSESCLHCYQMRLPHTNQINQQLPIFINLPGHRLIFTSIELHQVFVNNGGDLRAPRNQCQTGSRILQMSIHSTLFQLHYGPP